jgi:hypothetical protein
MLALRDQPNGPAAGQPAEIPGSQAGTRSERAIVCAACAGAITSPRHRITVQGSHEHRFMNPAGYLFHIGCFAEAIGCVVLGPPSLEYPWFPGFAWRFALCAQCRQHLGWHFASDGGERFFGLILNRLQQTGDPPRD